MIYLLINYKFIDQPGTQSHGRLKENRDLLDPVRSDFSGRRVATLLISERRERYGWSWFNYMSR